MKNVEVSIIIPVYNVAPYLECCFESIRNQEFEDFEAIIVNDGSTDNSLAICEKYQQLDKRFFVINTENRGVSSARNTALEQVNGKYICFIDSDDYWHTKYLSTLYNTAQKYNADMVVTGCALFKEDVLVKKGNSIQNEYVFKSEEAFRKMLIRDGLDSNPWGKLYRASLWKNYRFPVGKYYEDIPILYHIILNSNKVIHTGNEPLYFYRIRTSSTTGQEFSERRYSYTDFSKEVYDFTQINYPQYKNEGRTFYCNAIVENYLRLGRLSEKGEYTPYYNFLKKEIRDNICFILKSKYFSLETKLGVLTVKIGIYKVLRAIKVKVQR